MPPFRAMFAAFALLSLAACTTEFDAATQASGLGDFRLDRLVVIADDATMGPLSRRTTDEALEIAVTEAFQTRFSRFQGDNTYSLGIKVQAYVLAQPGIPILLAPRSMLLLSVNVYNDVPVRLNPETKNLTVFEDAGGDTVIGSAYTQTKEEQLAEIASNAAIEIEVWLRENEEWFGGKAARPEENGAVSPVPDLPAKTGS